MTLQRRKPFLATRMAFGQAIPAIVAVSLALACRGLGETSVSTVSGDTTITWVWKEDRAVGRFANGEWWVVGPITLTSISPADPTPDDGIDTNGTMVNLIVNKQGWSNRFHAAIECYKPDLNIARQLPYEVAATSSVITLQDKLDTAKGFESGAVLTVVDAPVAAGTFRPPTHGVTKPAQWRDWTVASLNYDAFGNYAPTANAPNPSSSTVLRRINHLFIDMREGNGQNNVDLKITGSGGGWGYGRGVATVAGDAVLALNCDYPSTLKETLMVAVVQRGIDAYGGVLAGLSLSQEGGLNHGRKIYLMAAAAGLSDEDILAKLDTENFRLNLEDKMFIYVNQARIDTPHWRGEADYTQEMLGMPDWGDYPRVERSSPDFTYTGYRQIVGSPTVAFVLCATFMNMREAINNEAMFQYIIERYFPIMDGDFENTGWPRVPNDELAGPKSPVGTTNGIQTGVYQMWKAHLKNKPEAPKGLRSRSAP